MAKSDIDLRFEKTFKAKRNLIAVVTVSVDESQIESVNTVMKNSSSFVASLNNECRDKLDTTYGISIVNATPPIISGKILNCFHAEKYSYTTFGQIYRLLILSILSEVLADTTTVSPDKTTKEAYGEESTIVPYIESTSASTDDFGIASLDDTRTAVDDTIMTDVPFEYQFPTVETSEIVPEKGMLVIMF